MCIYYDYNHENKKERKMTYTDYERIAEKYVLDSGKGLDTLRICNKLFEDDLRNYMLKLLLKEYRQNQKTVQDAIDTNKSYFNRLIKKYRG